MQKIDGNIIAERIIGKVKKEAEKMAKKPILAMFLVGDDKASEIYVQKKSLFCKQCGIESRKIIIPRDVSQQELLDQIKKQNNDNQVDALLVQLPLPDQLNQQEVLQAISPGKDVDCLNPENFGNFCAFGSPNSRVIPITARAIEAIINSANYDVRGKHAVVVGYSNIVGKPAAMILAEKGATVTICHEHTKELERFTKKADLLVVAAGKKHLINKEMVKQDAFVIDVGINREGARIYGDVDFEGVKEETSFITPVPGGVGPVTVAVLMENTLRLAQSRNKQLK